MNIDFWKQTWEKNEIEFHESKPDPLLVAYFKELNLITLRKRYVSLVKETLELPENEWKRVYVPILKVDCVMG
ncbi:MAG: hypothetical protein K8F52_14185 [Candidatus Scalindua rubra]|uniref:Putative orf n=1 Tax=Candidatus Scalindua brodae TaxID=237368 RepID=A0A0B0EHG6_9BACT|nr:MAG: putative orf [Candidatus Scalindua brodae]MBZ0109803.1 hypothetical protein [Candidatus Scalindua rubra]TWU35418.1 Thiopurine S-methyltransferase [Candidatus Brocadiaceae bacterium S225]